MKRDYKALKPGWLMTEAQWLTFWRKWKMACVAQGWDKIPSAERDANRYEVLLALGFASAKLINKTTGCDAVFKRFDELADKVHNPGPDQGRVPASTPTNTSPKRKTEVRPEEEGDRRRLLHRIGEVQAAMGEVNYPFDVYESILKDFGVVPGIRDMADLSADRLLTLSRTLTARLDKWNEEGQFQQAVQADKHAVAFFYTTPDPIQGN